MPICPVCQRSFDERFSVFLPPHVEAFDTIACALGATELLAGGEGEPPSPEPPPLLQIEMRPSHSILPAHPIVENPPTAPRRPAAARAAAALTGLISAPSALGAGLTLLGAGTAASIYLGSLTLGGGHTTSGPVAAPRTPLLPFPKRIVEPRPVPEFPWSIPKVSPSKPSAARLKSAPTRNRPVHRSSALRSNLGPSRAPLTPSPPSEATSSTRPSEATSSTRLAVASLSHTSPPEVKRQNGPTASPKAPSAPRKSPPALPPPAPSSPPAPAPAPSPSPAPALPGQATPTAALSPSPSEPSAPAAPPSSPTPPPEPPATAPTSVPPDDSAPTRPGYGYGDTNHDHTGPPGQDGDGNDKGKHH
jgi:hypothetical protein